MLLLRLFLLVFLALADYSLEVLDLSDVFKQARFLRFFVGMLTRLWVLLLHPLNRVQSVLD